MTPEMKQQIDKYWDEDEHEKIVQMIMAVPQNKRDIDMLGQLVVAYNNLERYDDAVALSMELKEESKEIIAWYYQVGYAMVYMQEYEKAAAYLNMGMDLVNKQKDTRLLPHLKDLYIQCLPHLDTIKEKLYVSFTVGPDKANQYVAFIQKHGSHIQHLMAGKENA